MGRGRESRRLVAKRVRIAKEREIFEKQQPAVDPFSPSSALKNTGAWITHALTRGMLEGQRRIELKQKALARRRSASIRLKSQRRPLAFAEEEKLLPVRIARRKMQERRDSRMDYDGDINYYDEEYMQ